jgi:hypothetical protein
MNLSIDEELQRQFPWFFEELGFQVISRNGPGSEAILQSDALRLRAARDWREATLTIASLSEPDEWLDPGFLWYSLTDDRPNFHLIGQAWFLRLHGKELEEALGPQIAATKLKHGEKLEISRQLGAARLAEMRPRSVIWPLSNPLVGRILMGPIGWLVAFALIVWRLCAS